MKKNKINFLNAYSTVLASILAILGFSTSCGPMEYGTPSAKFIVNGKVTSVESNEPVKNIRVIMQNDTSFTDSEGKYQVIDKWGFPKDQIYNISFQDLDSTLNGNYLNMDTIVEFKDPKFTGGDGDWYNGETSKQFDIKLSPKK